MFGDLMSKTLAFLATATVPAAAATVLESVPDGVETVGWVGSGLAFTYALLRQWKSDRSLFSQVEDLRAQRDVLLDRAEQARAVSHRLQGDLNREQFRTMQALFAVEALRSILRANGLPDDVPMNPTLQWQRDLPTEPVEPIV